MSLCIRAAVEDHIQTREGGGDATARRLVTRVNDISESQQVLLRKAVAIESEFDVVKSYRNRLMLVVAIETGARNSDIRGLRVEDVSSDEELIHVRDPKGSRAYDVPISRELAFELEFWCKHHRKAYTTAPDAGYLFPSQRGGKLENNSSLNRIVTQAAEDAGIQETIASTTLTIADKERLNTDKERLEWNRVTTHTLRHSYITLLKDSGVGIRYRQLVANHTDPIPSEDTHTVVSRTSTPSGASTTRRGDGNNRSYCNGVWAMQSVLLSVDGPLSNDF